MLAKYAANTNQAGKRHYEEPAPRFRSEYQRDRDRVIHSKAFRRLVYKTQVFINHEGDLYRTRLTHSLEVAQIARTIARNLHLEEDLTEAIALAHDLGHTPFGHAGQDALNQCMKTFGGFEHNFQSLRVVDYLEDHYANFPGLNLTFEAREGILKHCSISNAKQLGEIGQRFLTQQNPSLEAQLANIADEIAYNNHDIDDGVRSGLISIEQLCTVPLFRAVHEQVCAQHQNLNQSQLTHEILRRLIHQMVVDLTETSSQALKESRVQSIHEVRTHHRPLIRYSETLFEHKTILKRFLRQNLYAHPYVAESSRLAKHRIEVLFNHFFNTPKCLSDKYQHKVKMASQDQGDTGKARVIADYIAGMTDRYAIQSYNKITRNQSIKA